MSSSLEIKVENVSAAEANRLAAELEGAFLRAHPHASSIRKRPDEATMNLGTLVIPVVGSATAKGIAAWLRMSSHRSSQPDLPRIKTLQEGDKPWPARPTPKPRDACGPRAIARTSALTRAVTAGLLSTFAALTASATDRAERDTLTIGVAQYPPNFHPNTGVGTVARNYVLAFALRALAGYDPDWRMACRLCEALPSLESGSAARERTPDGRAGIRVTYRLREGLRWADGTPVSAEDLLFAWRAGRDPASGFLNAEFYRTAYEMVVEDPRTVTFRLDQVKFTYPLDGALTPLPAHLERTRWESDPATYRNRSLYEVDTTNPGLWLGPYRITVVRPGTSVTLERNPHWPGTVPAFRRIVVRAAENTAALEAQLLAGELDMIAGDLGLPAAQIAGLRSRAEGRFRFEVKPALTFEHIDLNLDHSALGDMMVRHALLLATDRAQIVEHIHGGLHRVAEGRIHPLDPAFSPDGSTLQNDLARAAALLEAAGWAPGPDGIRRNAAGERLSLELLTTAGDRTREATQQVLQAMWRRVGVEVRLRGEPPRVLFGQSLPQRRFQAAMFAWTSAPEEVFRTQLHSQEIPGAARSWAGQNFMGYRSREMDALLDALPEALGFEERRALWRRFQTLYARDLPQIPLWFVSQVHIWPTWLEGTRTTGHNGYTPNWVEEWRVR